MSDLIGVIKEIGRMESSVEWQIPNFPLLLNGVYNWCGSPEFRIGEESWRLGLLPNREREERNPASGWLRLDLVRLDEGPPATIHFSAGIRGSGGVEKIREGEQEFSNDYWFCVWEDFCSRCELMEHRTRLMPDDTLTISCVLKRPCVARGQQSSNKCVICLEGFGDTALYRCGHMYTCYDCALKLWVSHSRCPMCRKPIQDILKVYSDCS